MKNFPVVDKNTEREYWISRSIAVVVFLFAKDIFGETYILAEQRGSGTPDPEYIGKYCVPCGYLDYDETIVQAAQRELMEEALEYYFPECPYEIIKDMNGKDRMLFIYYHLKEK